MWNDSNYWGTNGRRILNGSCSPSCSIAGQGFFYLFFFFEREREKESQEYLNKIALSVYAIVSHLSMLSDICWFNYTIGPVTT